MSVWIDYTVMLYKYAINDMLASVLQWSQSSVLGRPTTFNLKIFSRFACSIWFELKIRFLEAYSLKARVLACEQLRLCVNYDFDMELSGLSCNQIQMS